MSLSSRWQTLTSDEQEEREGQCEESPLPSSLTSLVLGSPLGLAPCRNPGWTDRFDSLIVAPLTGVEELSYLRSVLLDPSR